MRIRFLLLTVFGFFLTFSASSENVKPVIWESGKDIIIAKMKAKPDYIDEKVINFENKMVADRPCKVYFLLHKNKLWRQAVIYPNNNEELSVFVDLLSERFGKPIKENYWETNDSTISLMKDKNWVAIIFSDLENYEKILAQTK